MCGGVEEGTGGVHQVGRGDEGGQGEPLRSRETSVEGMVSTDSDVDEKGEDVFKVPRRKRKTQSSLGSKKGSANRRTEVRQQEPL